MLIELLTCSFSFFGAADGCAGDNAQAKFSEAVAQYEIAANLPKGSDRQLDLLKEVHEQLGQIVADHPGSDVSKRIQSDNVAAITLKRIEQRIIRFDPEFGLQADATTVPANITSKPVGMSANKLDTSKLVDAEGQPDQETAVQLEPIAAKATTTKIVESAEPFPTVLPQSKPTRELAAVEDTIKAEAEPLGQQLETVQVMLPTPKPGVVVSKAPSEYHVADAKLDTANPKASSTLYLEGPLGWSHMMPVSKQVTTSDWRGRLTPTVFRMNLVLPRQGTRVSSLPDQAAITNASPWNIRKLQNNESVGIFLVSASQPVEVSEIGAVERDFRVVGFDFNSFEVRQAELSKLEAQVALMKSDPTLLVVIEGHADERGTREYNLALGEKRANQIRDYFVMQGIDPARIKTVSYGKERPLVKGSGEAVWAQNRRTQTVEFQGPKQATDNSSVVAKVQEPKEQIDNENELMESAIKIISENSNKTPDTTTLDPQKTLIGGPKKTLDWNGIYGGTTISYVTGENHDHLDGLPSSFHSTDKQSRNGTLRGAFVGYQKQFDDWVIGLEAAYKQGEIRAKTNKENWVGDLKEASIKVGLPVTNTLYYAFIGRHTAELKPRCVATCGVARLHGPLVGFGVDKFVTEKVFVGARYSHRIYDSDHYEKLPRWTAQGTLNSASLRLGYSFK